MTDWKPLFRNSTKLPNGDTLSVSLLGVTDGSTKFVRAIAQVSRKEEDGWKTQASTSCDIERTSDGGIMAKLPRKTGATPSTSSKPESGKLF